MIQTKQKLFFATPQRNLTDGSDRQSEIPPPGLCSRTWRTDREETSHDDSQPFEMIKG